jgi:hypothetical protein
VLQLLDRGRERGLADEQPLGRPAVAQLVGQDGEVPQLAQCDGGARHDPPPPSPPGKRIAWDLTRSSSSGGDPISLDGGIEWSGVDSKRSSGHEIDTDLAL